MKTALEELIHWCNSCLTDITISDGAKNAIEVTILRATDLLEKEKEQIKRAFEFGVGDAYNYNQEEGEEYFNQTYK